MTLTLSTRDRRDLWGAVAAKTRPWIKGMNGETRGLEEKRSVAERWCARGSCPIVKHGCPCIQRPYAHFKSRQEQSYPK
jgi:hypothetical protein